jgi:hypothetical protein
VFVQWLQLYEIDHEAIASVMLALGTAFANYTVYTPNDVDLLVVAWKSPDVREPDPSVFRWPQLREDLQRSRAEGMPDIEARRIGGRAVMEPLFRSFTVPVNSDYFPYLEHRAARARFRGLSAAGYKVLGVSYLPMIEMLEGRSAPYGETRVVENRYVDRAAGMRNALAAHRYLLGEKAPEGMVPATQHDLLVLAEYCRGGRLFNEQQALVALVSLAGAIVPHLTRTESRKSMTPLLEGQCMSGLGETGRAVARLIERVIERDGAGMRTLGDQVLGLLPRDADRRLLGYALDAAKIGAIVTGDPAHAQDLWQRYGKRVQTGTAIPIENRLLMSVAEVRRQRP